MTSDDESTSSAEQDDNRRRHPRYDLSMLVQLRFNDFDALVAEYASNISVGGMFIHSSDTREIGEHLYLQFYLRGGQKLIEGLAKVVRVLDNPGEGEERGFAVEFVNFDDDSMAVIEEICEARRQGCAPGK